MAKRQPIVDFCKQFCHLCRVLRLDFSFKTIHLVHSLAFVIATSHKEVIWVEQLESEESEDAFNRERAAINKVTIE